MRCLYCGKHLALFKKLTGGGEFCSDAHKLSYHEEYNKLALNRLMEAQTRQEDHAAEDTGTGPAFPSAPEEPARAEPTAWGGYFKQPVAARAPGGVAAPAYLVREPTDWPIGFPTTAELPSPGPDLALEPNRAGVIMSHRALSGGSADIAPAPDTPPIRQDARCAFPEHRFEIDTAVAPAAPGPVALTVCPALAGEPALGQEPAAGFQFSWEFPESLDLAWAAGLEFASSEEKQATLLAGSPPQSDASKETSEITPEVADDTVPEPERAVEPMFAAYHPVSATSEPVIDDDLLRSLFGGNDRAEPPPAAPPAAAVPEQPAFVPGAPSVAEEPAASPREETAAPVVAQPEVYPAAPAADTAGGAAPSPEPGSFLPVTIRPAGATSRPRLMQSFQAIALVSANPQIPAWNMLPLRPRMALTRTPGPGANLLNRGNAGAGGAPQARKSGSAAVDVANAPEPAAEVVPEADGSAKPRTGLSRWFKLSILVGVLGIAGGSEWLFDPAGVRGAGVADRNMTTELVVCRN
jgi:hypothetical protein